MALEEIIWKHLKRGTRYVIDGFGNDNDLVPQVYYTDVDTGHHWNRPCEEFFDGRYAVVGTRTPSDEGHPASVVRPLKGYGGGPVTFGPGVDAQSKD